MKLLFITSTRLGDAVLSTGLLDYLLSRGGVSTTLVCGSVSAEIFECVPGLERLIILEKKPGKRHWWTLWHETVGHILGSRRRSARLGSALRAAEEAKANEVPGWQRPSRRELRPMVRL